MGSANGALRALDKRKADLEAQATNIKNWAKSKKGPGEAVLTLLLEERKSSGLGGILGMLGVTEFQLKAVLNDAQTGEVLGIEMWVDGCFSEEVRSWFKVSNTHRMSI